MPGPQSVNRAGPECTGRTPRNARAAERPDVYSRTEIEKRAPSGARCISTCGSYGAGLTAHSGSINIAVLRTEKHCILRGNNCGPFEPKSKTSQFLRTKHVSKTTRVCTHFTSVHLSPFTTLDNTDPVR